MHCGYYTRNCRQKEQQAQVTSVVVLVLLPCCATLAHSMRTEIPLCHNSPPITGLDVCASSCLSLLHAMAGIPPAGASLTSCEAVFIRNLRWAAETIRPHGIQLVIEPINRRDMPGYFLNTADHVHQMSDKAADGPVPLPTDAWRPGRANSHPYQARTPETMELVA
jgi:hypothetical protein